MQLVFHRIKFTTNIADQTTYQDFWQLCETEEEAAQKIAMLQKIHGNSLDSFGIADIVDASEKSWIEK